MFARTATSNDINLVFKLGIKNANEWANQFDHYRNLRIEDKNLVLAEYGIAFLLIDEAFKAKKEDGKLQKKSRSNSENTGKGTENFVENLEKAVSRPIRKLEIDEFECAVLKTLLLLASSFPGRINFKNKPQPIHKCLSELMVHLTQKFPEYSPERFGELILLLGSIRCAVKTVYNQTKIPGIFHFNNFDQCLKNIFLT
uniref:NR LBD domain-containing protein n=1 Tax=Caenorhabditis tropicalis TaxID=1561998 RepID=A0A1I7UWN2_9PELO